MQNQSDKKLACSEFVKMGLRAFIKESFELIKNYTDLTNQSQKFQNQKWFHFARIIRNCLSHNFYFKFNTKDKKILPVSFKNKIITIDMDNTPLTKSLLSPVDAWDLFNEMKLFIEIYLI
jgi:hypothetical protein